MLICNFRKILVLSGVLLLPVIDAATEDFKTYEEIMEERESRALKCLQEELAKDQRQEFVNDKFESMACWGYLTSVKWMLSQQCSVKPDQVTMNHSLLIASKRGANDVVRYLLKQPVENLRPDQKAINKAYDVLSDDVCYKAPEDPLNFSMKRTIAIIRPFVVR